MLNRRQRQMCIRDRSHVAGHTSLAAAQFPESPQPASGGFTALHRVCMFRRMPRMQVYLPDDLYRAVKERGLAASELLQEAIRIELRRRELVEASDDYLSELLDEVGQPTPEETARAQALARRLARRADQVAG